MAQSWFSATLIEWIEWAPGFDLAQTVAGIWGDNHSLLCSKYKRKRNFKKILFCKVPEF